MTVRKGIIYITVILICNSSFASILNDEITHYNKINTTSKITNNSIKKHSKINYDALNITFGNQNDNSKENIMEDFKATNDEPKISNNKSLGQNIKRDIHVQADLLETSNTQKNSSQNKNVDDKKIDDQKQNNEEGTGQNKSTDEQAKSEEQCHELKIHDNNEQKNNEQIPIKITEETKIAGPKGIDEDPTRRSSPILSNIDNTDKLKIEIQNYLDPTENNTIITDAGNIENNVTIKDNEVKKNNVVLDDNKNKQETSTNTILQICKNVWNVLGTLFNTITEFCECTLLSSCPFF